ncbi:MAG TPA: phage baseplate assembly protein [Candidatus Fimivicinus intestinavium]|nr:phage baseplate assembly protein [Candidatus Fimivicinus intestinavium]
MWITQRLSQPVRPTAAENGRVDSFQQTSLSATGSAQRRDIPLYAPAGVISVPSPGEQVLLLPCAGEAVCAGVRVTQAHGLQPGELRLFSAGGASITLKNDGTIELCGTIIHTGSPPPAK